MAFQTVQPPPFRPEVDYNTALMTAYMNCVNALQGFQPMQQTDLTGRGVHYGSSHLNPEGFVNHVLILHSMILDHLTDDYFHTALVELKPSKNSRPRMLDFGEALFLFHMITQLFHRKGIFPESEQVSLLR